MSAYITIDDVGDLGDNSDDVAYGNKPDGVSWVEWRKQLRERDMDPEELAEREERRKNREQGYPQYKESWWRDFKHKASRSLPTSTTTKGCFCCTGLTLLLVLIIVGFLLFALIGFYLKHGGLALL